MKNIPIKFRGRDIESGELIFGRDIMHYGGEIWLGDDSLPKNYHINPDTLSQLIGYDANGEEIYEGDKLIDTFEGGYGDVGTAHLNGWLEHEGDWDKCRYILLPEFIKSIGLILKGNDNG